MKKDDATRGGAGYESRDMSIRVIGTFLLGLLAVTGIVLLVMWLLFKVFVAQQAKRDVRPSPLAAAPLPPEPRLQVTPGRELQEKQAQEDVILNSYGWVDRGAGVVRIPIDRAITLLAERRLPVKVEKERIR
ncbi:MAG: hypothetical protein C3F12_09820 [Candidatus Methylomirabilota bacterium]|nr:hypothetical protein [candidate division NC10 bacterium]PWB46323.1 MAG: hypothetical protein C3F12_09820 [candidate division NC10 bacterium]HBY93491.1 hypothetical protein [Chloroflexota bacterium]